MQVIIQNKREGIEGWEVGGRGVTCDIQCLIPAVICAI